MNKRVLCMLLAFLLCMSILPVASLAEEDIRFEDLDLGEVIETEDPMWSLYELSAEDPVDPPAEAPSEKPAEELPQSDNTDVPAEEAGNIVEQTTDSADSETGDGPSNADLVVTQPIEALADEPDGDTGDTVPVGSEIIVIDEEGNESTDYVEFEDEDFVDQDFVEEDLGDPNIVEEDPEDEEFADQDFIDEDYDDEDWDDEDFEDEDWVEEDYDDEDFEDEDWDDEDYEDEDWDDEDYDDEDYEDEDFEDEDFEDEDYEDEDFEDEDFEDEDYEDEDFEGEDFEDEDWVEEDYDDEDWDDEDYEDEDWDDEDYEDEDYEDEDWDDEDYDDEEFADQDFVNEDLDVEDLKENITETDSDIDIAKGKDRETTIASNDPSAPVSSLPSGDTAWDSIIYKSVAVFDRMIVCLRDDGTVEITGEPDSEDQDSWDSMISTVSAWENIDKIGARGMTIYAIRDGACISSDGEIFTADQEIVDISCGECIGLALLADGTVSTIYNEYLDKPIKEIETAVPTWSDIAQIAAGPMIAAAVTEDGKVYVAAETESCALDEAAIASWTDIREVSIDADMIVGIKNDGTVVYCAGFDDPSRADAYESLSEWTEIAQIDVCGGYVVGVKEDGTLVTAGEVPGNEPEDGADGDERLESYDISDWEDIISIDLSERVAAAIDSFGNLLIAAAD